MLVTSLDTPLDRLLEATSHGHGFWLINHQEQIEDILREALKIYGHDATVIKLNDLNDPLNQRVYMTIYKHRAKLHASLKS